MKKLTILIVIALLARVPPLGACDLCGIYSAVEAHSGEGFYAGAAEQFTDFGTLQQDGRKVPNEVGQYLHSSISQVFAGYNFTDRFGVQFNLPVIYRSFKRPEGFEIDRGTEAGIGDASIVGKAVIYRRLKGDTTALWNVFGGVEFPTGSTRRLEEELNETEVPGAPESGIHGHDLTLGSGSFDGIVGTGLYWRWRRMMFTALSQYSIRSEGDFDYQFANDLTWSGGPGVLLALNDNFTLSLQANVSGETKGRDTLQGQTAEDTGLTAVYLGPEFMATWGETLTAEFGVDIPVSMDNTALQAVPDYRIRGAFSFRF